MASVNLDDTIAAISTPIGEGGIGIVRLSGRDALNIADKIFLSKNGGKPSDFRTYTVHYGHIIEDAGKAKKRSHGIVDEVILTVMRAPRSYTKEDIVEINCHSGIAPLKKILGLVLINGARIAQPGEFTKRAFLNGRIDMLQAESVLDIIKAKTELSLKSAINNLEGLFSNKIKGMMDDLVGILAHMELTLDFSEEDAGAPRRKEIFNGLKRAKKDILQLVSSASNGKVLRQGIRAAICGKANVGKSSLMNAMLKESRAIVTHIPGTTRDTIEEIVNIKGIPVVLIDTAGISDTEDPVDKEGVKRSHISIQSSDLVLLVLDYGRKLNRNDRDIMRNVKDRKLIIVVNKSDLKKRLDLDAVRRFLPGQRILYVSAINLSGIDKLEQVIKEFVFKGKLSSPGLAAVSNERHLGILHRSLEDIKEALKVIKEKLPVDCASLYVRSAIESIGEITGHTVTEKALDKIFSEFCIGK